MPVSSRQIDGRILVLALAQMLTAEKLAQFALEDLAMDPMIGSALAEARSKYMEVLPGIQEMRNAMTHFEDWSRGEGRGTQRRLITAGKERRDAARQYWGFGYDPSAHSLSLGPHRVEVERAVAAATQLHWAIYAAAKAVDEQA